MRRVSTCLFVILTFIFTASGQELQDRLQKALEARDSIALNSAQESVQTPLDSGVFLYFQGRLQSRLGDNKRAVESVEKSLTYFDLKNSPDYLISANNYLTYLESIIGNWDRAMFFGQEALKAAETVQDTNRIAYALGDIAIVFHDMEDYSNGVAYAKRGFNLLKNYRDPNPRTQGFVTNSLAINFDDWDKPDSALFYHYENLKLLEVVDSTTMTNTFNNIGNTLLKQKDFAEAEKWINVSLKYNYLRDEPYKMAANYTNLANIAYNLDNFSKAEVMLDSAKKYVDLSGSREKVRDYLWEQYRFQKRKGDLNKAMAFLEDYSELKDSIFKDERVQMIGELQTKYEVSKKETELAQSRADLAETDLLVKNRNNQLLLLLILILIVLGISFFIYYRQKNKTLHLEQEAKLQAILAEQETQNRLLEQRNRISSDLHDNIGAQLTFIVSSLDNLKFVDLPKEKFNSKLDQISAFTVETVNELRDTIWAMNKESISVEDLEVRLNTLISKAKVSCPNIDFELIVDEGLSKEKELNSMEGVNYYRIAQEALNNAVKHSGANKIWIELASENSHVKLSVKDNGQGISGKESKGNGMHTMKNRAERIGRKFSLDSRPEAGTQVCIS
ncbi:tetratricopeptide repeat-containing sensor histidine kinase [Algoriphagus sediminis]|uniref:histidine kinase n=1 Tax=Algoriphagus sediminis TaxID=3057113 RepID=A0ABT7YBW7_9BACT|nr:sensor histidine kinase [Algoriphagus sediminis]MDN3203983.1 sensor histidine kinase [Algoriphagus sediminis]